MKIRLIIVWVVSLLVLAGIGSGVCAQEKSTKKSRKERKKERKQRKQDKVPGNNEEDAPLQSTVVKQKKTLSYPASKTKKRYRVDVVLPLYLDEMVDGESITFKGKVPEKAAAGLAFYQGVKLATDSLKKAGLKLDIYVHDAGSLSEPPEMLVSNHKLDSTDLIIGAVEQHDIPVLARYAKKKKINFVSALTNSDGGVKDNQYFTMLQPTVKSHCEFIIDDLSEKYAGKNVTLLYRTSSLADDNAALYMLNDLYSEVTFKKLLCNTLPDKSTLSSFFDKSKPNIVVVSILDAAVADSLLQSLSKYFPNTHFEVYGMPTWNDITDLRSADKFKNLAVNVTYPFHFDVADSALRQTIRRRYAKEFGGHANEMVLRGYEAMLWYGSLLRQYGTVFNNDYKDLSGAPFTQFKIKPRWDRNGSLLYLENKHIYMSTYQGGIFSLQGQ